MAKTILKSYLVSISGEMDSLVHYTIGQKTYARRYVIPRNPRSAAQQSNRSLFAEAMSMWKTLSENDKQQYRKKARRLAIYGHNLFISQYIKLHKHENAEEIKTVQSAESVSPHFSALNISEPNTCTKPAPFSPRTANLSAYMHGIYRQYSVPV